MMITFKYNDVPVSMDEDTGKFSIENRFDSMTWAEIKRRIDVAAKTKYKPVQALLMDNGYRNDFPEIVTITRPVIGSEDRVWIKKSDNRRETANVRSLIDITHKDEYMTIWEKIQDLKKQISALDKQIGTLARAPKPEPIEEIVS